MQSFSESLNSALPHTIKEWNNEEAIVLIRIRSNEFPIRLSLQRRYHQDMFKLDISFSVWDPYQQLVHTYQLTGKSTGSEALGIYSTIVKITEKYIAEFDVQLISFVAQDIRTTNVYKKLATSAASKLNGTLHINGGRFDVMLY